MTLNRWMTFGVNNLEGGYKVTLPSEGIVTLPRCVLWGMSRLVCGEKSGGTTKTVLIPESIVQLA